MRRLMTWCLLPIFPLAALAADAKRPADDAELAKWVDERVQERQPPATDKRFDEIGWAKDIREAEKLAKENKRPVFLFTHDGRMNFGRC